MPNAIALSMNIIFHRNVRNVVHRPLHHDKVAIAFAGGNLTRSSSGAAMHVWNLLHTPDNDKPDSRPDTCTGQDTPRAPETSGTPCSHTAL